jgi:DNA-directed RNA polymerase specialized sigma24 family protein
VKTVPGTLQEGGAAFRSTHWTVVLLAARSQSEEAARAALASLCQTYWPPLYTFLRRRGRSPSEAQDLTQSFVAHLIERNTFAHANPEKGQLRTFLLGSLQHFLANEHDRAQALKRGGGQQIVSMDDDLVQAEAALHAIDREGDSAGYDRQWAANVVSLAWERLHREMVAEGKGELIEALKPLVVGGIAIPPTQEDVAAKLGMPITTFRNALFRLRQRYRECVRAEVARTVEYPAEIDEEMRYLLHVLLS